MTRPSSSESDTPVIIAAIDGSAGSQQVLRAAGVLSELCAGQIAVAHVIAPPSTSVACAGLDDSTVSDVVGDLLPDVVEALLDCTSPWTLTTLVGNPALELARLSRSLHARAIVVGADTPGWASQLRRLSCGSVPSRLTHDQHAPVIVIPDACSRSRAARADQDHLDTTG
jgi:nucleotide-binding universal stress UspA family protein